MRRRPSSRGSSSDTPSSPPRRRRSTSCGRRPRGALQPTARGSLFVAPDRRHLAARGARSQARARAAGLPALVHRRRPAALRRGVRRQARQARAARRRRAAGRHDRHRRHPRTQRRHGEPDVADPAHRRQSSSRSSPVPGNGRAAGAPGCERPHFAPPRRSGARSARDSGELAAHTDSPAAVLPRLRLAVAALRRRGPRRRISGSTTTRSPAASRTGAGRRATSRRPATCTRRRPRSAGNRTTGRVSTFTTTPASTAPTISPCGFWVKGRRRRRAADRPLDPARQRRSGDGRPRRLPPGRRHLLLPMARGGAAVRGARPHRAAASTSSSCRRRRRPIRPRCGSTTSASSSIRRRRPRSSVAVDPALDRRAISDLVYGVNFASPAQLADGRLHAQPLGRQPHDALQLAARRDNSAVDWFYFNYAGRRRPAGPAGGLGAPTSSCSHSRAAGAEVVLTLPTIGRVAGPDRERRWGFSQSLYGPQLQDECSYCRRRQPWCNPDAGNGRCTQAANPLHCDAAGYIVDNDPNDTTIPISPTFVHRLGGVRGEPRRIVVARRGALLRARQRADAVELDPPRHPSAAADLRRGLEPGPGDRRGGQGVRSGGADPRSRHLGLVRSVDLGGRRRGRRLLHRRTRSPGARRLAVRRLVPGAELRSLWRLPGSARSTTSTFTTTRRAARRSAARLTPQLRLQSIRELWDPSYTSASWIGDEVLPDSAAARLDRHLLPGDPPRA